MSALREALAGDGRLRWRFGAVECVGDEVLEVAQAGVALVTGGAAHPVPSAVWVAWCAATAERAVAAWHAGPGQPAIPGWITATLDFLREVPVDEVDRVQVLVFAASVNTARAIHRGARDVALLEALVRDTWSWAFRRALEERRCPHAPFTLARDAVAVHRALARREGGDPEAAATAERSAQAASLRAVWRER